MDRRWMTAATAAMALAATLSLGAQAPAKLSFEVASVRPSEGGRRPSPGVLPTRVDLLNASLRDLILRAFRKEVYEYSGPAWLLDARFDIHATYPDGATAAQVPEMLQDLLVRRFGLVMHLEPRRIDAYDLVVGKDGLKMTEVEPVNDIARDFSVNGQRPQVDQTVQTDDGPHRTMVIPGEVGSRWVTNRSLYEIRYPVGGTTQINAIRMAMSELVSELRVNLDRPVLDRTGLSGVYRFQIELDRSQMALRMLSADKDGNPISRDPTGVSTFKSIESLGLKLEEHRTPFDVLVVDTIERTPTEN